MISASAESCTVGSDADLRLTAQLRGARTPLDIVRGLAEGGLTLGLNLWAIALENSSNPVLCCCSTVPMSPVILRDEVVNFRTTAMHELGGRVKGSDWINASLLTACIAPLAEPLSLGPMIHRDSLVWLCDETRAIIRASCLAENNPLYDEQAWDGAQILIRAAIPYLRAVAVAAGDSGSLLCPESSVYIGPYFLDCLDREIERARRHQSELAIAIMELRPLELTREPSPQIHARIGSHLHSTVRRTDLVGRLGPRSYGAFFFSTGPRSALIAAGRIAEAMSTDPVLTAEINYALGVSGWEVTGPDAASVLRQARSAASEALLIAPGRAFIYI